MPIDDAALELLVCPETREPVALAPQDMVSALNKRIARRRLVDRRGETIKSKLDGALVREDGKIAYAIRDDIPQMLIDEGIPMEQLER